MGDTRAVDIQVVGYGRPATEAIAGVIDTAQAGHPLDPVTVIVASNLAGLSLRRLLGSGQAGIQGLTNVSFVTPFRLAELLGAEQVSGHPITNAVLAATARQVLRDEPGSFRAVAEHPASEQALMALYAELSHLRPETLTALADRSGRTAEVIRLFRAMRSRLVEVHDEDDLARAAVARITTDPSTTEVLGTVAWHLPDRLTPVMGELVASCLRARPSHAIVALTGDTEADATVLSACELAGVLISPEVTPGDDPVVGTRIISVSDDDDEVRTVIREIAALAEAGVPLDRIGVFHPTPDPYARRIHEQLTAAGIPHNGPSRTRLADRAAGRTLLAALTLPGAQWSRARVMALLTGGPVRHDGRTVPSGAWENVSRQAGVIGGRDDWRIKLDAFATAERQQRNRLAEEGDQPAWRLDRKTADADFAESLADFVDSLAGSLEALDQAVGWTAKASAASELLEQLLGPEGRRTAWPDHERAAAERIESALTRLQQLDDIEPEPTTASFVRAVTSELEIVDGRVGRFGEGVVFGPLAMAAGLDLDAIFVVGLAEGTCPAPRREDPLLTDEDREASNGELVRREERLQEQHRHYLAALAAGGHHRILLFPRGNLRGGRNRLPSRWLLQTASALNGSRLHSSAFADLDSSVVTEVASFARGLVTAPTSASAAERDLAVMAVHAGDGGDPASHPVAPPALRRALGGIAARRSEDFTEWDGNLTGHPVPSPADGVVVSASRLQTWAECPLRYYFAYVLRLSDRDDPETLISIGAADRGTLVHEVLEVFIGEVIDRPGGPPAPTEAWTDADRDRLHAIADEVFDRFEREGKTGRALLWRLERQLVLADLDDFLDKDNAYRAAFGATPVQVELPFGYEPAEPLSLDVGDGRTLQFRGRADRVDITTSGRHIVLDYKTGKGDSYKKLDTDPVLAGTTLQLGLYAEAARDQIGADDVEAYYWMISSKGGFKRHGYEWTEDRKDRFLAVLGTIVEGIDTGTFPARPGAYDSFFRKHENCGWCDFNDICPRDRDDHEEAMKEAPELQILQRLLPPEADDDGATGDEP